MSEIITKEKYSRLLEEFSSLKKDNEELLNKVKVLSEEVFWLKKELFASRSERRPIKEKNTEEIDLVEKAEEKRSEVATESIAYTRKKRKPEENRQKLPENLKRIVEVVELPESERSCDECDSELVEIGEEITEELEYIPASFYVREINVKNYPGKKVSLIGC